MYGKLLYSARVDGVPLHTPQYAAPLSCAPANTTIAKNFCLRRNLKELVGDYISVGARTHFRNRTTTF